MQLEAICTDIDGTLLDENRRLSSRLLKAILMLPKEFPVILASSRMPAAMRHLQKEMGRLGSPLICYNGGYILDEEDGNKRILEDTFVSLSFCKRILEMVRGSNIHVSLYHGEHWYEPYLDKWAEREIRNTKVNPKIKDAYEVLSDWKNENVGAHKLMCMGPADEIQWFYTLAENEMGNDIHLYRSKETYIEIAPKIISKASALKMLLKSKYGLEMENVMAFGDNYNDIEMLQQAGHGVAVENAREEVKAVANEVTLSGKNDGVAVMIEKYLL